MSLTSQVLVGLTARLGGTGSLTTPAAPYDLRQQFDLGSGTGAGKADRLWVSRRTLAASATEDLDLSGALTDVLGGSAVFAKVKAVFIRAAVGNANNVVVGAASSNAWAALLNATGTLTFRPGAAMSFAAGIADATTYAVTAGTGDLLKVANSGAGTSVTFDIAVLGTSV